MTATAEPEAPPLNRQERRKRELHAHILDTAIELFAAQGIEATTTTQICEVADVARKTFFNHFTNKSALIQEFASQQRAEVAANLNGAAGLDVATPERLAVYFDTIAAYDDDTRRRVRMLIHEIIRVTEQEPSDRPTPIRAGFANFVSACVARGDTNGAYGVEILSELMMGAFYAMLTGWAHSNAYPLRQHCEEMSRCLSQVFCGPPFGEAG